MNLGFIYMPWIWFLLMGFFAGACRMGWIGILSIIAAYISVPMVVQGKFFPLDVIMAFATASIVFLGWIIVSLFRKEHKQD